MRMNVHDLKDFLDEKSELYNRPDFIETDPISVPHLFSSKEDIEIIGFLVATIAWGQRVTIINNANRMVKFMGESPYDFVMSHTPRQLKKLDEFVHRTFNGTDLIYFIQAIKHIYFKEGGLEQVFKANGTEKSKEAICHFREVFFSLDHPYRTEKHVSNPAENSAAKRINMYLRWMVRNDKKGVDFGIWKSGNLTPADLMCPLDVHSGNVARKLGLLKRTQNDWKAVEELMTMLKQFDPADPVKYDFALFGLGAFEKF